MLVKPEISRERAYSALGPSHSAIDGGAWCYARATFRIWLRTSVRAIGTGAVGLLVLATSAITAPESHATEPIGVSAVVLSKQTVNGKDYIVSDLTIAPHGSTGWHYHRGEIYGVVRSGTLTHYGADCQQDGIYHAGDPILDPTGPDHVHLAMNLGDTPVELEVTYVDPAGAPTADSVPSPGCDFS